MTQEPVTGDESEAEVVDPGPIPEDPALFGRWLDLQGRDHTPWDHVGTLSLEREGEEVNPIRAGGHHVNPNNDTMGWELIPESPPGEPPPAGSTDPMSADAAPAAAPDDASPEPAPEEAPAE